MCTPYDPEPEKRWHRKNYDKAKLAGLDYTKEEDRRKGSEIETNRDLQKPVEQLVCDVHEEAMDRTRSDLANIAGAQKRMVSLMARVAQSNDVLAGRMLGLTWAVAIMTAVILIFTVLMWDQNRKKPIQPPQITTGS